MPPKLEPPTLVNLGHGVTEELFQRGLADVLKNIADVNNEPTDPRKITLEFVITPKKDRSLADIKVKMKTTLPGMKPAETHLFLARDKEQLLAYHHDAEQKSLFETKPSAPEGPSNVTPLRDAKKGE